MLFSFIFCFRSPMNQAFRCINELGELLMHGNELGFLWALRAWQGVAVKKANSGRFRAVIGEISSLLGEANQISDIWRQWENLFTSWRVEKFMSVIIGDIAFLSNLKLLNPFSWCLKVSFCLNWFFFSKLIFFPMTEVFPVLDVKYWDSV